MGYYKLRQLYQIITNSSSFWCYYKLRQQIITNCDRCYKYNVITNYVVTHLWTATSETATENSLGNADRDGKFSAKDEKLHIISIFSTRLTELKFSP